MLLPLLLVFWVLVLHELQNLKFMFGNIAQTVAKAMSNNHFVY